jgi:carbon-monoxide dehydrogenase medium subunit
MWQKYIIPASLGEALKHLADNPGKTRIIAGGTDLMLEIERGMRKEIETVIDVSRLPGISGISMDGNGQIHIGAGVTHNEVVGSKLLKEKALPLVLAAWNVGSPQIRNRGTIAGNLVTASPANDTITPLIALGANVIVESVRGKRTIVLEDFYTGVRKTVLQPDEMLIDITFPAMSEDQNGVFIKFALRKAQAISVLNLAMILRLKDNEILDAVITLGAVAPTIIHAIEAEEYLKGKNIETGVDLETLALTASAASRPIDDIRSSAKYRHKIVGVMCKRAFEAIREGKENESLPLDPILLWGKNRLPATLAMSHIIEGNSEISTCINGEKKALGGGADQSMLNFLRKNALLTGVKEGCAEGECGACTVFLDGLAVMSCLVPAERAQSAEIVTVEGLAEGDDVHPVQQAFIDEDAVQCGYCTPGFIMSAVKLLEEKEHPDRDQIKQAITGNLCRCTGYYKIITAIEKAGEAEL